MRNLEAVFTELNQLLAYANSRFFDIIDLASIQRGGDLKIRNACDKLVADYTDQQTAKRIARFKEHSKCLGHYKGKMAVNTKP